MATKMTLTKPKLSSKDVVAFAEDKQSASESAASARGRSSAAAAPMGQKSGLIPEGDVRLTANIRADLHMRLKMRAVQERTTVGELIEKWIEGWKS